MMDVSLQVGGSQDTLELYFTADGDFDGLVNAVITIRYDATSGAVLDTANMVRMCPGALPLNLQTAYHAGFVYRTFVCSPTATLANECPGLGLFAGQPMLVAKIPVIQWGTCTEMAIVNDAYTAAWNLDYWVSLGGIEATDSILTGIVPTGGCGALEGRMFQDLDGDCLAGPGDVLMADRMVTLDPLGLVTSTDAEGRFLFLAPPGNYTLTQEGGPFVQSNCPPQDPVPVSFAEDSIGVLAMANAVTIPFDLQISGGVGASRAGFASPIGIMVTNRSALTSGPVTVSLALDPQMSHASSSPAPASVLGNVVTWNLPALGPFEQHLIQVKAMVSAGALVADLLNCTANATNTLQESELANNTHPFSSIVATGYAPNMMQVLTSSGTSTTEYVLGTDEWVEYQVDFQNTGGQWVNGVNIDVFLPSTFDAASLEVTGTSRPLEMKLHPNRYLSILMTDPINFSAGDEYGSRGFVSFRLRPTAALVPGQQLILHARIHMPYVLPALLTNTTLLNVTAATGVWSSSFASAMRCYPDPAQDLLFISGFGQGPWTASVLSVDGRTALPPVLFDAGSGVDVAALTPGVYLLRLLDPTGDQAVLRFVKE
jgi:hypothetical protein